MFRHRHAFAVCQMVWVIASSALSQQKQPAFPQHDAKWTIRGKVRLQDYVEPQRGEKARFSPRFKCNPIDLTLPETAVYVVGIEKRWSFAVPREVCRVELRAQSFEPLQAVLMAGQTLEIVNASRAAVTIMHTQAYPRLFGFPKLMVSVEPGKPRPGVKTRNEIQPLGVVAGDRRRLVFARPEQSQLVAMVPSRTCKLHILPHPIFATTDTEGRFRLPRLPDGDYHVVAKHPAFGMATQRVSIRGADPKPLSFVLATVRAPAGARSTPSPPRHTQLLRKIRVLETRLRSIQSRRGTRAHGELTSRLSELRRELKALSR